MGTTDRDTALAALEAVSEAVVDWALLHGAHRLAIGDISDLDICTRPLSATDVENLLAALQERGLRPISIWDYDVSASSLFLASEDLLRGVQLDIMCDETGRGKYGFRTQVALHERVGSGVDQSISAIDSWLYQLRKRGLKRQADRVDELLSHAPDELPILSARAEDLFSPRHRDVVRQLLIGRAGERQRLPSARVLRRLARRPLHPAGVWCHLEGDGAPLVAEMVVSRCAAFLPRAGTAQLSSMSPMRLGVGPGLVPWRIGLVASFGRRPLRANATTQLERGADRDAMLLVRNALADAMHPRAIALLTGTSR